MPPVPSLGGRVQTYLPPLSAQTPMARTLSSLVLLLAVSPTFRTAFYKPLQERAQDPSPQSPDKSNKELTLVLLSPSKVGLSLL